MAMLNNQMVYIYIYIGASLHSQTHPLCFSPSPAAQKPLRCRLPTSHAQWLGRENGREASAGRLGEATNKHGKCYLDGPRWAMELLTS